MGGKGAIGERSSPHQGDPVGSLPAISVVSLKDDMGLFGCPTCAASQIVHARGRWCLVGCVPVRCSVRGMGMGYGDVGRLYVYVRVWECIWWKGVRVPRCEG